MKQKTFYDGDFNVKKLDLDKIIKFVLTSGIGFLLDFISYFMMTQLINISVVYANFTSSIIGATFVFIVSMRKIFIHDNSKIPLMCKYILYIMYQLIMITVASLLISYVNKFLSASTDISLIVKYSKMLSKILVTPLTLSCNYIFMRTISKL